MGKGIEAFAKHLRNDEILDDLHEVGGALMIHHVHRAADLVKIIKDLVVPDLVRDPTEAGPLRVVDACASGLRLHATAAGGSFGAAAGGFAGLLEGFLEQAHAHPVGGPYADLQEAACEIRRRAERLLQTPYTIRSKPLVVAAAAAAGQLEAAEAEEEDA